MNRYRNLMFTPLSKIFLACLCLSVASCNIINPDEDIPTYLYLHSPTLITDENSEGLATEKISDAWVFVNDESFGVYELPAHIPLLADGRNAISILAGIKNNGSSVDRNQYPFYNSDTMTLNLVATETDTIIPEFEYLKSITFELIEDFETGNEFEKLERITDSSIAQYGSNVGAILLGDSIESRSITSLTEFDLPSGGVTVYLELDYKNDNTFFVGIIGHLNSGEAVEALKVVVTPQENWNKIYVDLTEEVGVLNGGTHQILFFADLDDENTEAKIYLDNIKLIHF